MRCKITGKIIHQTKEDAIVSTKKQSKVIYNVYYCKHCKRFHLGRSRNPARTALRIDEVLLNYEKNRKQHQEIYQQLTSSLSR